MKPKLNCCFVTAEGEVRAWVSPDFKSNEPMLELSERTSLVESQPGVIRAIL